MNFNQLKYIVAVDKRRNFNRAAEYCEVAQSTLSKEIQRLEKEFSVMIFDRSRHPVVPTMKGADLIKQARILLEEQEKFLNIAVKRNNLPVGNFRLGVLSILAPYLLPLFSQALNKKYPQLDLSIQELNPLEMEEAFEAGILDGAIGIAPFHKEGFYETPLFEEEFVLYISESHYLASYPEVKWEDIPLDELLLQEDMKTWFCPKQLGLDQHCLAEKNFRSQHFLNGSLETIRKIIDRNGGLTLVPQLACLYMSERRMKMVHPIAYPGLSRSISFVSPRGFHKNRISKVILQEIKASIPIQHLSAGLEEIPI